LQQRRRVRDLASQRGARAGDGWFPLGVSFYGFSLERNRPPPRLQVFPWLPACAHRGRGVRRLADHSDAPYVLFICQDEGQRDDFIARADQELTGHRWHPNHPAAPHQYTGRRHILFCDERDIHRRHLEARRLAPNPPGHPARNGGDAEVRGVKLPGSVVETGLGSRRRSGEAVVMAGRLSGQTAEGTA
jgi:hypothetical protein